MPAAPRRRAMREISEAWRLTGSGPRRAPQARVPPASVDHCSERTPGGCSGRSPESTRTSVLGAVPLLHHPANQTIRGRGPGAPLPCSDPLESAALEYRAPADSRIKQRRASKRRERASRSTQERGAQLPAARRLRAMREISEAWRPTKKRHARGAAAWLNSKRALHSARRSHAVEQPPTPAAT